MEAMRFDKRFQVHEVYDGRTLVTFTDDIPKDSARVMIKDVVFSDVFLINGRKLGHLKRFINESETYPHYASKRMLLVLEELVAYVEILQKLFLLGSKDSRYGLSSPKEPQASLADYLQKVDIMFEELCNAKYAKLSVDGWKSFVFGSLHDTLAGGTYEEKELDKKIFPEHYLYYPEPKVPESQITASSSIVQICQEKIVKEEPPARLYSSSLPELSSFNINPVEIPKRRKSCADLTKKPAKNTIQVTRRYHSMLETLFTQSSMLNWNNFKSLMSNLGFRIKGVGGGSVFEFKLETCRFLVHRPHPKPEMNKGKLKWVALKLKKMFPDGIDSFSVKF